MIVTAYYESPIGRMLLAADGDALVGLWLEGQKYFGDSLHGGHREQDDFPVLLRLRTGLTAILPGKNRA